MKLILSILTAAALFAQASVTLERAIRKETLEGDLKGAIALFEKAYKEARTDRATAVKALVRLAECHQKLGDSRAKSYYEQIVREFGDQTDAVAMARLKLGVAVAAKSPRRIPIGDVQQCTPWNVSSDGKLFGATEYLTGNIAVIDTTTGECRPLTKWGSWNKSTGYVDQGAISRDGKWMASWHYAGQNNGELRVIGTAGANERTVFVGRHTDQYKEWGVPLDWSPDGQSVLIALRRPDSKGVQIIDIAMIAVADGALRVLHSLTIPGRYSPPAAFSPDGQYVAWSQPAGDRSQVMSKSIRTGATSTVSEVGFLTSWTDAGLFFTRRTPGKLTLFRQTMQDGRPVGESAVLRELGPTGSWVGASAQGSLFYREGTPREDALTAEIDLKTGEVAEPRLLAPKLPNHTKGAAWSRDGRWVSFVRVAPEATTPFIVIRELANGSERELKVLNLWFPPDSTMSWSADSKSLYAGATNSNGQGLYRIDLQSGESKLLDRGHTIRTLSPDNEEFYSRGGPGNRQILATNLQTGVNRVVYQNEEPVGMHAVSPDGKRIAFVSGEFTEEKQLPLMLLDLASGGTRKLDSAFYTWGGGFLSWSWDGKHLLARGSRAPKDGKPSVTLIGVDGGMVKDLDGPFGDSRTRIDALTFHPDGKSISWTASRYDSYFYAIDK